MAHDTQRRENGGQLRTFHLFAGAGGGILADLLLDHVPVGACEIKEYPRRVLLQRQRDGILPTFPIWDDICTLDGKPWRGLVDVVAGGFPCPDFSNANQSDSRKTGLKGERGRLWFETRRIIGEMGPRVCWLENVTGLVELGLPTVLSDLHTLGYNVRWCVLGSRDCEGIHKRERVWIYAVHADSNGLQTSEPFDANVGKAYGVKDFAWNITRATGVGGVERYVAPHIGGSNDAVANWMDRFKAAGNGQDAMAAALAWQILTNTKEATA